MGAYNDDVLFIHIPKTGGTSVKRYMKECLPNVLCPDPADEVATAASKLPIGHVRLADIERFTGRSPDSWKLILAVLRDPYEQQLSQWSFWRDRFAKGGRHVHDVVAAAHLDLTAWLEDPRCDFHVWYLQHIGHPLVKAQQTTPKEPSPDGENRYEDFGGCYRFWLEVDGEFPINLKTVDISTMGEVVPKMLEPYKELHHCFFPTTNPSPHGKDVKAYYTPRAARMVEEKFAWAFANKYPKWLYSDVA